MGLDEERCPLLPDKIGSPVQTYSPGRLLVYTTSAAILLAPVSTTAAVSHLQLATSLDGRISFSVDV